MENPFMNISPRKNEKIVGVNKEKIKEMLDKKRTKWTIFIVSGEQGSGKSQVIHEIEKQIRGITIEQIDYCKNLGAKIKSVRGKKKVLVEIDKVELSETTKNETLRVLLDTIADVAESGITFIISVTPKTLSRLLSLSNKFKNSAVIYNMPPLTYEESRELIISRLNEVRKPKSESIEPFTDKEVREIWKKSVGNPKMVLLLCASIYEFKKGLIK